jgi:NADH-quinone oxidoreductase subunit J
LHGAQLSFWLITVLVLASGAVAAFSRNIIQAAYSLFFTLIGMAGYYVLLGSDFLAITQVIVYVGGILVLLMFGVLLTNRPLERAQRGTTRLIVTAGLIGAALLLAVLVPLMRHGPWVMAAGPLPEPVSNLRPLGRMLLAQYLVPFELSGLTLLLCLVGAAYLVRRKER